MSNHSEKSKGDEPGLAKNETKVIFWMKFVALACLIAVGVGMAWLTFALIRQQESSAFESSFNEKAARLITAFYSNTINQIWIASTMGKAISSQEGAFPFVTVPQFEAIGFGQLQLIRGASFAWAPLLNNQTEKRIWEVYAVESSEAAGLELSSSFDTSATDLTWKGRDAVDGIFELYNGNWPAIRRGPGPYSPVWQIAPIAKTRKAAMFDQFSEPIRAKGLEQMIELERPVLSSFLNEEFEGKLTDEYRGPRSILFSPLHFGGILVGSIQIEHEWSRVFEDLTEEPFDVVLRSTCGETASFQTNGHSVKYLGAGDKHKHIKKEQEQVSSFRDLKQSWDANFADQIVTPEKRDEFFLVDGSNRDSQGRALCSYSINVYPAQGFEDQFFTARPAIYAFVVSVVFVFCVLVFLAYNYMVERRQRKILDNLVRSEAVINSLFPPTFRDRLFTPKRIKERHEESRFLKAVASPKIRLTSILNADTKSYPDEVNSREEPIAEMFSNTTVIFADIAGFSAWSSQREPYQVFKLLETIYAAFDSVASSLSVFKVETIGDCYVAVTGLPTPQEDHSLLMARFAVKIIKKMGELTKELEISLGPGTAELGLRVGLHSGTVTAGVLRGEKSRFQLFGDTMNVSSRMESTGTPGKVQVSQDTAELIVAGRKGHWLVKRRQAVEAKGLGLLQTYWLNPDEMKIEGILSSIKELGEINANDALIPNEGSQKWGDLGLGSSMIARKLERLVDWNVEVLLTFLTKIVESRRDDDAQQAGESTAYAASDTSSIVSEVTESIQLPRFTRQRTKGSRSKKDAIILDLAVRSQLREFVCQIASGYRDVPFHNFEHASHVALSANKLMKRIISPDEVGKTQLNEKKKVNNKGKIEAYAADLHNLTFGISSDPLTQFSIVFAALVHDVEHYGVPNSQLVKEQHRIAVKYSNKSVAEQHSVDLALETLSDSKYRDLHACICHSEGEKLRFRQLLINAVLATDIVDTELRLLRKKRWTKAFLEPNQTLASNKDANRKATIVLEHIIQASDVAHTMQHWHIFCKWNEKLYQEMYIAYLDGRAEKDPSDGWYEGEIGFFDHYIIPLARNLKDCGVFGVSSDEYLMYALANRDEWKAKGEAITARMIARKDEIVPSRFKDLGEVDTLIT